MRKVLMIIHIFGRFRVSYVSSIIMKVVNLYICLYRGGGGYEDTIAVR